MTQNNTDTELTVRLHELCELLHVSTHRPRLTYKVRDATVQVKGESLNAQQVTTPSWKLMPAQMSQVLDRCENNIRKLLDQYTEQFRSGGAGQDDEDAPHGYLIRGLYMVPQRHVETLLGLLHAQHNLMRDCVREWVEDPTRLQDAIRIRMGDAAYEIAKKQLPTAASLLQSTRIDIVAIPFGLAMSQLRRTGEQSFLKQARERTSEMLEQVARQMVAGPREELAETVTALKDLIERDGRVTTKSVEPIRRAFEKIQMFDFVADDTLRAKIAELKGHLDGMTPGEQDRQTATDSGLLGVLRSVADVALDDVRITQQFQVATSRAIQLRRTPAPVAG